jgi:heptosyltransferase-2
VKKILVIQTAFIGDVILASGILESLHAMYPQARLHLLVRKGNEHLFTNHPYLDTIICWDKKKNKIVSLVKLISTLRKNKYDCLLNLQRFFSSGLLSFLCHAKQKRGFDKNPFSFCYTKKVKHRIGFGHETERNFSLADDLPNAVYKLPRLYPSDADIEKIKSFQQQPYVCIAPTSVWFTKQLPLKKWLACIANIAPEKTIYLIGASSDTIFCNRIIEQSQHPKIKSLCGQLTLLESAALMKQADMNFVNDSAPLHLASAMNAPVTVYFCSTIPQFGFGPLSDQNSVKQTSQHLNCRPCGLHGYKQCPLGHFKCAETITI